MFSPKTHCVFFVTLKFSKNLPNLTENSPRKSGKKSVFFKAENRIFMRFCRLMSAVFRFFSRQKSVDFQLVRTVCQKKNSSKLLKSAYFFFGKKRFTIIFMRTMKAVLIEKVTAGRDVFLSEVPVPQAVNGWVPVKVVAFGMNHSEKILRLSEINADYIQKPVIPGIECVGIVEEAAKNGSSRFKTGDKVAAFMGGMGRSFNGSYAQYALLPESRVFKIENCANFLTWTEAACVPETYFTAWGSLFECLSLRPSDKLLIRGATCALGYAAIQIAKKTGCAVTASTHKEEKLELLSDADEALLDEGNLRGKAGGFTKVLDLVGAATLHDSLMCASLGGVVCVTGTLGGVFALDDFNPIKLIPNGVYLTSFHSNWPDQKTVSAIFDFLTENHLKPRVGKIFDFENIKEACVAQDEGQVNGKIAVRVSAESEELI